MGTTSDKLTYLNETKTLLKNKINITGANITTDTFRQYPTKLQNALLNCWNNEGEPIFTNWGTKVNGEGTNVKLDNTINARMKITPKGNTSQNSTTGKQEFNFSLMPSSIVVEENGRVIKPPLASSGNGYVATYVLLKDFCPNLQAGDTAYLYCDTNYNTQNKYIQLTGTGSGLWNFGTAKTLTQNDLDGSVAFYSNRFNSGETSQLILTNFRITKTQNASWEPYTNGVSPNPNYPQNVNVVSGDNDIKVGQNIWNYNGTNYEQGFYNSIGGFISRSDYRCFTYDCKQGDLFERTGAGFAGIVTFWNNSTFISSQNFDLVTPKGIVQVPQNANKIKIAGTNTSSSSWIRENPINYQVNLGEYELCKIGDYQDYIYKDSGKWYLHKEVGKVVLNGTQTFTLRNTTTNGTKTYAIDTPFDYKLISGLQIYSNYFTNLGDVSSADTMWNNNNYKDIIGMAYYYNQYSSIKAFYINTTDTLPTWFSSNNTKIYYVLETPTEEEITNTTLINQLEQLKGAMSYEGQTNINGGFMIVGASALGELE